MIISIWNCWLPRAFAANSLCRRANSVNEAVPSLQNLSSFEVKFAPFRGVV